MHKGDDRWIMLEEIKMTGHVRTKESIRRMHCRFTRQIVDSSESLQWGKASEPGDEVGSSD